MRENYQHVLEFGYRPDDGSSSGQSNGLVPAAMLADPDSPPSESPSEQDSDAATEATLTFIGMAEYPMLYGFETMCMDFEYGQVPEATRNFLRDEGLPYYRVPEVVEHLGERYVDETPRKRYLQDVTVLHLPPICVQVDQTSDHEFFYDDDLPARKC